MRAWPAGAERETTLEVRRGLARGASGGITRATRRVSSGLRTGRPSATRATFPTLALATIGLLAAMSGRPALAPGQESARPAPARLPASNFANPPLKYFGPDNTQTHFVPGLPSLVEEALPPCGPAFEEGPFETSPWEQTPGDEALVPEQWLLGDGAVSPIGTETHKLSEHKKGFFQKVSLTGAWLDRGGVDDYGITEVDFYAAFALPLPTAEWPLVITPAYNQRFLDGPQQPNLPPRLYEAFVDFLWLPRFSPRWSGIIGVAPMVRSDFEIAPRDALMITGKGLARYDCIPDRLQILFGVLYLNREDIRILPVGGILWKPNDDWNLDLIYPRPKVSRRIRNGGTFEDWVYVGGEFGGNSYYVERQPGVADILTLFDIRVLVGIERRRDGGAGQRLEAGYVFNRSAEYFSGAPGVDPADTFLVRAGIAF